MNLLSNIFQNLINLQNDLIGISISFPGILKVFINILFSIFAVASYHSIGEKLCNSFIDSALKRYEHFIFIAVGYIIFGTSLALVGAFSLLYPSILTIATITFFIFGVYFFVKKRRYIAEIFYQTSTIFKSDRVLYFAVLLFVAIIALRLLIPEIAEDDYHTDLPDLYLSYKTTMLSIIHILHVVTYPQLAEMHYLLAIFLGLKDATRYLHFSFFILIVCLLIQLGREKNNLFKYSPLLFVTTPLVIKYAPTSYTDFFMVFCFLLSSVILIHSSKSTYKKVLLSGIILGGAFSVKLWTLIFLPLYLPYIFGYLKNKRGLLLPLVFIVFSLLPPLVWYVRAYILKGNPIYPIFSKPYDVDEALKSVPTIFSYVHFNWSMFSFENIILFSPLFFVGLLSIIFRFKILFTAARKSPIVIFFSFISFEHVVSAIAAGRYLLAWYTFAIFVSSVGLKDLLRSKIAIFFVSTVVFLLFSYYFLNTLLSLPYAFNWADQNKYLTRILSKDNSSYYDFDRLFDNKITKLDLVATYGISGFYYADFKYVDINNIYPTKIRQFNDLSKANVTKLLIKGGDFLWFCDRLKIQGCREQNVMLLATFPEETRKYNLYKIVGK